ncbi:hypothetical protein CCACVL1_06103 [Corchorus capsularis]|uniref:Uncharacterized protein n=1 Tax=Corchorus capsularis TaxID=210143 RepID=A0A1R3JHE2_COCAP|nr:hypothetical protein CCACVL1_06103 [Corchorus capsularis]
MGGSGAPDRRHFALGTEKIRKPGM